MIRKPGILGGTTLAVFMALVHTVNDAMTAILGALLPTLQERFDARPTLLALIVAVFWIASSITQPVFGALGEDVGLRFIGSVGVLMAATFLSLIGVASELWLVFVLLVIGGLGSAALHPVGTTIAGSQAKNQTLGVGLFTAGGMVGFALGPVLILYVVAELGTDATIWLMAPGLLLGAAVALLLPQWEPHPRRPLRRLFEWTLARGPVGLLAVASMFSALAYVTFTSSVPIWLVRIRSRRFVDRLDALGIRLRRRRRVDRRRLSRAKARSDGDDRRCVSLNAHAAHCGRRQRACEPDLLRSRRTWRRTDLRPGSGVDHHRPRIRSRRTGDGIRDDPRSRLSAGRSGVHRTRAYSGGGGARSRDLDGFWDGDPGGAHRARRPTCSSRTNRVIATRNASMRATSMRLSEIDDRS